MRKQYAFMWKIHLNFFFPFFLERKKKTPKCGERNSKEIKVELNIYEEAQSS